MIQAVNLILVLVCLQFFFLHRRYRSLWVLAYSVTLSAARIFSRVINSSSGPWSYILKKFFCNFSFVNSGYLTMRTIQVPTLWWKDWYPLDLCFGICTVMIIYYSGAERNETLRKAGYWLPVNKTSDPRRPTLTNSATKTSNHTAGNMYIKCAS